MTAMKVIHAQSALTWNQVAQNKSDVKFIVKTHFSLHTHTLEVFSLHGNF